jgi:hypothetical protein
MAVTSFRPAAFAGTIEREWKLGQTCAAEKGLPMTQRLIRHLAAPMTLLVLFSASALAAETYQANLGPMPLDQANRANKLGRGDVTATLDGNVLVVGGNFIGLPSPATKAHLYISPAIGVPGGGGFDLIVTEAVNGTVSGQLVLNAQQRTAFRTGRLYVQIDSQKAPTGNLWGWLLPQHFDAPPGLPQAGPWFLPQLNTPTR